MESGWKLQANCQMSDNWHNLVLLYWICFCIAAAAESFIGTCPVKVTSAKHFKHLASFTCNWHFQSPKYNSILLAFVC